ncbi:endonuclease/exonuclease/phosphatase family protein [Phaeobacter sp. QD34_3]|uniref:endonuclease/exonuclease/phosphatase family protein n=1 Tax=unclassified Phaeobacter TaxID=2621772 RepID=UPI00237F11C1|nr:MULTISPECIES: endonuclease/exonuclease/phosphatase family protein [unclassified Phaeobacter]MDE4134529.1 endonuclease/exonuclease/phosphatase family protein [Phaeobacter sp. QD34_3]MDE4138188.1 endonuclease/exonuclease/phosphatase family protein [Phaeobacter sp. QD34_24]
MTGRAVPLAAAFSILLSVCLPAWADSYRIATFNTELSRKGPGLLLRDIEQGKDAQIAAVIRVIQASKADVIALQGIDWDYENLALKALQRRLDLAGATYPYLFARRPNAGFPSGLDLDGDGRLGGPGDSQGYGDFTGKGGIALLSRHPILDDEVLDLSPLLWRDLPAALLPQHPDGSPFPTAQAQAAQRLSSTAHWVVPIRLPDGQHLDLMVFQAGPPVFDGPEDRNGRRNHDEIRLWQLLLDARLPAPFHRAQNRPFVIVGGANLDPEKGDGLRSAIQGLLADPRLKDPRPGSQEADLSTVDWQTPGRMRVDYVLPSANIQALDAGVLWSLPGEDTAQRASRHRLVWVEIDLPPLSTPETD